MKNDVTMHCQGKGLAMARTGCKPVVYHGKKLKSILFHFK